MKICQRFAHAHEHHVRQSFTLGELILGGQYLFDDFVRLEVTFQAHRARETETAVKRAADLRGEAQRQPVFVGVRGLETPAELEALAGLTG